MPKLKTNEIYLKEIESLSVRALEPYTGANINIMHECKTCRYTWRTRPSHVLAGHACPVCASNKQKISDYPKRLKSITKTIKVCEPYINYRTKIKHQCLICKQTWDVKPDHILSGHGCPLCAVSGIRLDIPVLLYYICIGETYYKIGVTNNTVKKRFAGEVEYIRVVWEHLFNEGLDAAELERAIKIEYKGTFKVNVPEGLLKYTKNTEIASFDFLGLDYA